MLKKIIYILILIVISANFVWAETENAYLEYNGYQYEFRPGDDAKFIKNANKNLALADKAKVPQEKVFYLQEAMRYYFLLSQIKPDSIEAQIGLGRVYDGLKLDKFAKKHFFKAINLDSKNPKATFYFGDFYFNRAEYINALYYYKESHKFGYAKNYSLNYNLGVIYEKLADIESAIKYYSAAAKLSAGGLGNPPYSLNIKDSELKNKIRSLESINYFQSQYYLFNTLKRKNKPIR